MRPILLTSSMLLAGTIAAPALAGTVTVTIPRLSVAEYHRPYVAVWIEPAGGGAARTLAVWYEVKKGGNEPGTKWLSDLRAWWRKGGRSLTLPADGVSGATRAPGQYSIPLPADLKPGAYVLNVEAARETGGRELVSVPLNVPRIGGSAAGKGELGTVTLSAR
ncbi:DUF2271 domain-containing protein [Sphingomonas sp. PB4P5]|uniref:DUF2271 domain-containing protein n=1 Tax=Parasphingomonas puruogangriensis TaxID=3096155 RepID=UPI002FC8D15F